ncbi:hypothetical protein V5O48_018437 [Marasmius crinis-equi]|uniref:Uncharacterized protein n=1 Tax=Marasmius crinis-equi TaxID=585013 RepID=A0ABR3EL85_9AGAR
MAVSPPHAYPANPPISLHDVDVLEKLLLRKELAEALNKKIEHAAALRGVRDRRCGNAHLWTSWRVSYGVTHWPDVGRVYRKCLAIGHWRHDRPCVSQPRFMTSRLNREQLVEIEELRAMYDALGSKKWSATTNAGGSAEVERGRWIRFLWKQREQPTIETLVAVFWRLLDRPTDEEMESTGWETDSSDGYSASWIVAEPDSDEELHRFRAKEAEQGDEEDDEDELLAGMDEDDEKEADVFPQV